jgi:Calcineurin-like phosphoesterase
MQPRLPQSLALLLLSATVLLPIRASAACNQPAPDDTHPPRLVVCNPHPGHPIRFVVYGDTRFTPIPVEDISNSRARQALVQKIATEHPAAIFIGGDIPFEGAQWRDYDEYLRETAPWRHLQIPVFPVLGNHEYLIDANLATRVSCNRDDLDSQCLKNWWKAFDNLPLRPHRWYSVAVGTTLLALVLDSDSSLTPGSPQRTWLERQVADLQQDSAAEFLLILLHRPPVRDTHDPVGTNEREIATWLATVSKDLSVKVIVAASHIHNYERYQSPDGTVFIVSGGGGAHPHVVADRRPDDQFSSSPFATAVNFHYMVLELSPHRLSATVLRWDPDTNTRQPWITADTFRVTSRH